MKHSLLLLFTSMLLAIGLHAQTPESAGLGRVDTTWPGVEYIVTQVIRIPGDRLLFAVVVHATNDANPGGTLIGTPVEMPEHPDPRLVAAGYYRPEPFTIKSATMTDDASQRTYSTVPPDPSGPSYIANEVISTIHPGEGRIMTIQFPAPPPPPPVDGIVPKQTVSLSIPKARGPITKVVIPPPPGAPGASPTATP